MGKRRNRKGKANKKASRKKSKKPKVAYEWNYHGNDDEYIPVDDTTTNTRDRTRALDESYVPFDSTQDRWVIYKLLALFKTS